MLNLLLVGAGRMGLRHLRGMLKEASQISVVYHHRNIEQEVRQLIGDCGFTGTVNVVPSIKMAASSEGRFDAAILSATAENRASRLEQILPYDIPHILVEKPLEQSRNNVLKMQALARRAKSDIRCNNVFREQAVFEGFRNAKGAVKITVNSGAIGLGCGGIHWIDLALYLSGSGSGKLVYGKLDRTPIASGRGGQFRDFGGSGLFEFEDGSSLYIRVSADSSASVVCVITQEHQQLVIDYHDGASLHQREENVKHPNYLYGQGYLTRQDPEFFNIDPSAQTGLWLQHVKGDRKSKLPSLDEAVVGHELLFDLLETGGDREFPIT